MENLSEQVAIGTWPTPDKPVTRLETELVNILLENKIISEDQSILSRYRLAIGAIRHGDHLGYIVDDMPSVCNRPNPPKWCQFAGVIVTDGRTALIDALYENELFDQQQWQQMRNYAQTTSTTCYLPGLMSHISSNSKTLDPVEAMRAVEKALLVIDGSTPAPVSTLNNYCQSHPFICDGIQEAFKSKIPGELAAEVFIVHQLYLNNVLGAKQTSSILDTYLRDVAARQNSIDIAPYGGVIIDALDIERKTTVKVNQKIARVRGSVGYIDPDSPWADKCASQSPPIICQFIREFPVAVALLSELAKHEILSHDVATKSLERLATSVGINRVRPLKTRPVAAA